MKFTELSFEGKTKNRKKISKGGGNCLSHGVGAPTLFFSTSGIFILAIFWHDVFINVLHPITFFLHIFPCSGGCLHAGIQRFLLKAPLFLEASKVVRTSRLSNKGERAGLAAGNSLAAISMTKSTLSSLSSGRTMTLR